MERQEEERRRQEEECRQQAQTEIHSLEGNLNELENFGCLIFGCSVFFLFLCIVLPLFFCDSENTVGDILKFVFFESFLLLLGIPGFCMYAPWKAKSKKSEILIKIAQIKENQNCRNQDSGEGRKIILTKLK